MDAFRGKVVWITGAAGGLGRALTFQFLKAGAKVAASDLDKSALKRLEDDAGPGQLLGSFPCNVTDAPSMRKAAALIRKKIGPVDVLVVNAGISHRSAFAETNPDVIRRVVDVNLMGAVYTTHAALDDLRRTRGRILVLSSMAGVAPLIARTGYAASKHALHGFFNSLYTEIGSEVHIQIVCPMFIRTPLEKSALGPDGRPLAKERSTIGSYLSPEEAADRIVRAGATDARLVFPTFFGWFSYMLYKVWPSMYERLMTRRLRDELGN